MLIFSITTRRVRHHFDGVMMHRNTADLVGDIPWDEKLRDTLKKHLPQHVTESGKLDIPKIAKDLNMTRFGVDLWFDRKSLPHRRAKQLIKLPGSTLTPEILAPLLLS